MSRKIFSGEGNPNPSSPLLPWVLILSPVQFCSCSPTPACRAPCLEPSMTTLPSELQWGRGGSVPFGRAQGLFFFTFRAFAFYSLQLTEHVNKINSGAPIRK